MKQKPKPFRRGNSKYFYYYDSRGRRMLKSTHAVRKWQAEEFINDFLGELERPAPKGIGNTTFGEYAEPFFDWDRCPHVRRLQEDGKSIGNRHVRESRHRLTKYILPDSFSDIPLTQITRGDVLDLRSRLREKQSDNAVNKIMKTLKTVFAEALHRQDIENNPTSQIGNIKYEKTKLGIFTAACGQRRGEGFHRE